MIFSFLTLQSQTLVEKGTFDAMYIPPPPAFPDGVGEVRGGVGGGGGGCVFPFNNIVIHVKKSTQGLIFRESKYGYR